MKHRDYFYTPPDNIKTGIVEIIGEEHKHLSRVLRKNVRDIVQIVDGKGNLYTVLLTEITRNFTRGKIEKRTRFAGEPHFELTLAQAVSKGNRFDLIIEKGTEIGVSAFVPLICENSVMEITTNRLKRWDKLAIAAIKQCGRSVLPDILPPQSIHDVMDNTGLQKLGLIAHPEGKCTHLSTMIHELKKEKVNINSAIVLIGPEAGFSEQEVRLAVENNFKPFTLGPRRLRSETAGIVASAILMELVENQ